MDALAHPYLDEGRLRYHSCMCTCCYTTSGGLRQYTGDFEPATSHPFDDLWERKLTTVQQVKGKNRTDRRTCTLKNDTSISNDFYTDFTLSLSRSLLGWRVRSFVFCKFEFDRLIAFNFPINIWNQRKDV